MKKLVYSTLLCASFLYANSVDPDILKEGKELFEQTCISCHGANGKGETGMQLIVKPRDLSKSLKTEKQMYNIIRDGARHWGAKSDIMPAWSSVFNEDQLQAVTKYISVTFNSGVDEKIKKLDKESDAEVIGNAKLDKWGEKIFNRNCKFCHGSEGHGDGIATKSPVDSIFPYDLSKTQLTKTQIFLYTKYGSKYFGTHKSDMPAWGKKYSDVKLRAVAKYIDEVIRKK
jgi:mono/diheme cytochrome c family protein